MSRITVTEAAQRVREQILAPASANDGEVVEILLSAWHEMHEEKAVHDAMLEQSIRLAWQTVATCPYKDAVDGCCHHPGNTTPECHEVACPLVGAE